MEPRGSPSVIALLLPALFRKQGDVRRQGRGTSTCRSRLEKATAASLGWGFRRAMRG